VVLLLALRSTEPGGAWSSVAGAVFILTFATTGALVASRHPANPVGWVLCLSALSFATGGACVEISDNHGGGQGQLPPGLETAAAWVGTWVWMIGVGLAATYLLLLFPDGRLPSPRWRPVAWLAGGSLAVTVVSLALTPGRIEDTSVSNPIGVPAEVLLRALTMVGLAGILVSVLASCASLVARYRSTGWEQRQQLKWVAYCLPLVLLWLGASLLVESTQSGETAVEIANTLTSVGLTVVPVAIAVAMLRHRLYDIDVVINRTLVYASLTGLLAVVYLASVLVLQVVLSPLTQTSDLAVAASTLAAAAAFRPARSRIQAAVNRRFFRRRYDAARTVASFTTRLRDQVDVDAVGSDLRTVVADTVSPAHVSLWLRGAP
jgi:hypothetical protein